MLISIIQEQHIDPICCRYFHFEPYSLQWQSPHRSHSIEVHGELFTSQAFIEAHQKLQDLHPEANCILPQRIVALMFWSDVMQLTHLARQSYGLYICTSETSQSMTMLNQHHIFVPMSHTSKQLASLWILMMLIIDVFALT